ncbi:hypothetical protein ASE07_26225 [Noviherbaspirillum sp. Root189]|nr:hypothetical protein ASE07_26225 [Noviherbaspirillum sp. Root189]
MHGMRFRKQYELYVKGRYPLSTDSHCLCHDIAPFLGFDVLKEVFDNNAHLQHDAGSMTAQ